MKREFKEVWCVVLDPKGAVNVQLVKLYRHEDRYPSRVNVHWRPAPAFKSEIWSQRDSKEAAEAAMVDQLIGRLVRFEASVKKCVNVVNKAECDLARARQLLADEIARAKAAGVDL